MNSQVAHNCFVSLQHQAQAQYPLAGKGSFPEPVIERFRLHALKIRKMDRLSIEAGYPHGSAMALNQQGVCYELSGDLHKAIELNLQAEKLSKEHSMLSTW